MASIHIKDIQNVLAERGEQDALSHCSNGEGYFLEIRFDNPGCYSHGIVDEEYRDKVITVDCPYGTVTIVCNGEGQLVSIDLS